jgi:hypothetical protein
MEKTIDKDNSGKKIIRKEKKACGETLWRKHCSNPQCFKEKLQS